MSFGEPDKAGIGMFHPKAALWAQGPRIPEVNAGIPVADVGGRGPEKVAQPLDEPCGLAPFARMPASF